MKIGQDIEEEKLKILNNSRDISRLIQQRSPTEKNISSNALKTLKKLKLNEKRIKSSLFALTQNQNLLLEESFLNLSNGHINNSIRNEKLKEIRNKEETLNYQLQGIKNQVDNLIFEETKSNKKNNIKEFLDRFKLEDNNYIQKAKEYQQERDLLRQKRLDDIAKTINKREIAALEKQKEIEEMKQKKIDEIKMKELGLYQRKTREINERLQKSKSCVNICSKIKLKDCAFYKMEKEFEKKQRDEVLKMKYMKRGKLAKLEDISEIRKRIKRAKLMEEKNNFEKSNILKQIWKERVALLPEYKGHSLDKCEEELKKEIEKIQKEKNELNLRLKQKKEYQNVFVPKPHINQNAKKERENLIYNNIKNLQGKQRIKFIQEHRPKKLEDPYSKFAIKKNNVKKEEIERSSSAINSNFAYQIDKYKINKRNNTKSPKEFNYLKEMRDQGIIKPTPIINWDAVMHNLKGKPFENIQVIQKNAEALENKAMQKKKLLQLNGWNQSNQSIGEEATDLLINSIQGKLRVIKALQDDV